MFREIRYRQTECWELIGWTIPGKDVPWQQEEKMEGTGEGVREHHQRHLRGNARKVLGYLPGSTSTSE